MLHGQKEGEAMELKGEKQHKDRLLLLSRLLFQSPISLTALSYFTSHSIHLLYSFFQLVHHENFIYCTPSSDLFIMKTLFTPITYSFVNAAQSDGKQFVVKQLIIPVEELANKTGFADEVKLMSRFSHPSVVALHDSYIEDDVLFILMEHCEGGSLYQRIVKAAEEGTLFEEVNEKKREMSKENKWRQSQRKRTKEREKRGDCHER